MSTTILTDAEIFGIFDTCSNLPLHYDPDEIYAMGRAIEQAILQSPEVRRLRAIEKAARRALAWTEAKHRPPVREEIPTSETARVRVHALADLHDALNPNSPAKQ